jgi:hypothetical protein
MRSGIQLKALLLFVSVLSVLFLAGCGGSKGAHEPPVSYSVNFYDENLDRIKTVQVEAGSDFADIGALGTWYLSGETSPVTTHEITQNINFYAIQNVHEIYTEIELNDIRDDLNGTNPTGNYILMNDIHLTNATLDEITGWNPIGLINLTISGAFVIEDAFVGIFEGNGHKITGLHINSTKLYNGLFGYLNGTVKNLAVEVDEKGITASDISFVSIGGIVGGIDGNITNVHVTGGYIAAYKCEYIGCYAGGIVGEVRAGNIANSYSTVNVFTSAVTSYAGGIAGGVSGNITNVYATGDITTEGTGYFATIAGGIVGYMTGNISNAYSTGNISSSSWGDSTSGGIAGRLAGNITNTYSTGNISSSKFASGIAGEIEIFYNNSTVTNCAAANEAIIGNIYSSQRVAGEFMVSMFLTSFNANNNFANQNMTLNGATVSDSASNGIGKPLLDLQKRETYENDAIGDGLGGLGWKFGDNDTHPWKWDAYKNSGYPYFYWQEL